MTGKVYRKRAMHEFGRKNNTFHVQEMLTFLNNYKNEFGKKHRSIPCSMPQLVSLLVGDSDFTKVSVGMWKYTANRDWLGD